MGGFEQTVVFTHASIVTKVEADTEGDMVTIFVNANQKRDKFVGVMFGDTIEETCQKALKKVNNPPRMNIVIPVVNRQEVTIEDPTVPMAEYTSLYQSIEFRTNGALEFIAFTINAEIFICEEGLLRIEELFRRGYRIDSTESNTYKTVFNRISVEIFKEENGTKTKIGYGYGVMKKGNMVTYSINYTELLKNLGYIRVNSSLVFINTNIKSEVKEITLSQIKVVTLEKTYEPIDNIEIGEIRDKTHLNVSYDDINRIVCFDLTDNIEDKFVYEWKTNKTPYVTDEFLEEVYRISTAHGIDPDDFMAVMAWESWLDPTMQNKSSKATGLIQFMPNTAVAMGTTIDELKNMKAKEQLFYVEKYLFEECAWAGTPRKLSDLYMVILWPAAVTKDDSYILWEKGGKYDKQYKQNSGLDVNGDGKITKSEALKKVTNRRDENFAKKR